MSRQGPGAWWGIGAVALVLFADAVAVLLAPDGHLAFGVESASSAAAGFLQAPSSILPRAYALFAGMVAAINPCGFALLPGYLALYLQQADRGQSRRILSGRPVTISLTIAVAFVAVFGLIGLALGLAGSLLSTLFPLIGLLVGVALVIGGAAMLAGRTIYGPGQDFADRLGGLATGGGLRGYFAYGVAYALASLGCALPVFLSVVGSATLFSGWVAKLLQVILYGIGMAVLLAIVTMVAALFKRQALVRLRTFVRWFEPLSATLLLIVGAYVIYYWLTIGGVLRGAL